MNPINISGEEESVPGPEKTHEEYRKENVELSETTIDNGPGEDDFLISIAMLMQDNDEYQGLLKEKNFGIKEKTKEQKIVADADNVFTIKHFIRENLKEVQKNKELQENLKARIIKLKKLRETQPGGSKTEEATLITLEAFIDSMLDKDTGEKD